ncbi:MAG TPA: hypothetical protein VGB61_03015, partial [Pyrinomonadaceae bacterium]
ILFEMLAGRPPFDAPSATAIALKHVRETPPDIRELRPDAPAALAQLVADSLAKEPDARPQTANEFASRLQEISQALDPDDIAPLVLHIPSNETFNTTAQISAAMQTSDAPPEILTFPLDGAVAHTELHSHEKETDRAGEPTYDDPASLQGDAARAPVEIVAPTQVAPVPEISEAAERSGESVAAFSQSGADDAARAGDTASDDEAATVVTPSPSISSRPHAKRRPFPLALVAGSLALAAVLGLLLYALINRTPRDAETTNTTPSPVATPTVQAEVTPALPTTTPEATPQPTAEQPATAAEKERVALRSTIDGWIAAHNTRNLTQVTNFYMPNVSTFYLAQNTTRAAVRAEKARLFQGPAMTLRRTSDPQITFVQDGGRATTLFRKSYNRSEASQSQSGEVLQEIVWQKTNRGWKIISERDLRVLR